jgi:anti-sigma regulatory factor (Ser/Thr protein kinase)
MELGVIDRNLDLKSVSEIWKQASKAVFQSLPLNADQQRSVLQILGEAITNAYQHAKGDGEISWKVTNLRGGVLVVISNPSDGFSGQISECPEGLVENGRGCHLVKGLVNDLCASGIQAEYSYYFDPDRDRTNFRFLLCK